MEYLFYKYVLIFSVFGLKLLILNYSSYPALSPFSHQLNIYKAIEEVPKNVLNELTSKRQTVHCPFAVAEYDNYCSAFNATTTLTDTNDWRRGLRVELVMKLRKNNPEGGDKENKNSGCAPSSLIPLNEGGCGGDAGGGEMIVVMVALRRII